MKRALWIISSLLIFAGCRMPAKHETGEGTAQAILPRVLIITSGYSEDKPQLAQGIVVAMQSFNKYGAMVRLEPRDILFDQKELAKFNILILSTFPGYHDADLKYSLSCLSDEEMHNIALFVENGGVLISGENIGRNYNDGTDRINLFQHLNPENWELSKCFGVTLTEKNMTGYSLAGNIKGYLQWDISRGLFSRDDHELWTLVPESSSAENVNVLAYWKKGQDSTGAVIEHKFGKGKSILLASSGLLHPRNDGGLCSEAQIDDFYRYIIDSYCHDNGIETVLNPWPDGYEYAFSVSLNAEGEKEDYERVFKMLEEKKVSPTLFVNGSVESETRTVIKSSGVPLASSGQNYENHAEILYPRAVENLLMNEITWETDFKGFRFPFTSLSLWSILALDEHGYSYESSIGADNLDFFYGSVVPYNLVISVNGFYKSTEIMEMAPCYHDDYYFLEALTDMQKPDSNLLEKEIEIYKKYLDNFWNHGVKPYHGLMVYLGHPGYVGYNDSTMAALSGIIDEVRKDNTWIATLDEIAAFRKGLGELQFRVYSKNNEQEIEVIGPGNVSVTDVCLKFNRKIKSYTVLKGKATVKNASQLIFNASDGQLIKVTLE
jgi:peptidoglycan/xylan/chitin deacetylase (PgdA/CDA1 family)